MGLAEQRAKNSAMAAYMKANHITREHGRCPMGCGLSVKNGGHHLTVHIGVCRGPVKLLKYKGHR